MNVKYGDGTTEYGSGVSIELSGVEAATAIDAYLVAHGIHVSGPRTITVNGELCESGRVYVDPSGYVISGGEKFSGRGPEREACGCCNGTGKIRDTEFVDGDEQACMTCNGKGY